MTRQYYLQYDGKQNSEISYSEGNNIFPNEKSDLKDCPAARWVKKPETELGRSLFNRVELLLRRYSHIILEIKVETR